MKRGNFQYVVGIDEVGRGPLAGPVAVCAVLIKKKLPRGFFKGIRNSKALSENARREWVRRARDARAQGKIDYAVSFCSSQIIDREGISRAIRFSIARALSRLHLNPKRTQIFLDGSIYAPAQFLFQKTIIGGDEKIPVIALASILAKVRRDTRMRRYAKEYPEYGFEKHVGYGTSAHYKAIRRYGISKLHRRSFLTNVKFKN